jgi:hypothetical protein
MPSNHTITFTEKLNQNDSLNLLQMKVIHPRQYLRMVINTFNIASYALQEKLHTIDADVIMLD